MSFADERGAFENRFADNYSSTPVKFENVPFEQPATSWVQFDILPGRGAQVTLGGSQAIHRYGGVIQITINTVEKAGTNAARILADVIEPIFRQVQFSSGNSGTIHTQTPYLTSLGVAGGWYRLVVSVPYFRDRRF